MRRHPQFGALSIERVAPGDDGAVQAVQAILAEAADWSREQGVDQWPAGGFPGRVIRHACRQHEVFLCRRQDDPAGTLTIQWTDLVIWGVTAEADAGYLHRLAIRRRYKGLGGHLLEWAEAYAAAKGKQFLRLDCMAENEKLNQYYRHAGYTFCRRIERSWWKAHLYEKRLAGSPDAR